MKILAVLTLIFILTTAGYAQLDYTSQAADFFMHDRLYDMFLRDYLRFEEPRALRIEYLNVNWLDSDKAASEYADLLSLEGLIPFYANKNFMIDVPIQYLNMPVWAENGENAFGGSLNTLRSSLRVRWSINDQLKSVISAGYNVKGVGDVFGESMGREINLLKAIFSYDLHHQLNFAAGGSFSRYYYDTQETPDTNFEIANRLYFEPTVMINWHPNEVFTLLLGIPNAGVHLELGGLLNAEARVSLDKKTEIALNMTPYERIIATLRFQNSPYMEVPAKPYISSSDNTEIERLYYTSKSILFEIGCKLNPAALASLGFRYSPGNDLEIRDRSGENTIQELNGKPHFAIGATFTVDIEALLGMQ